MKEQLELLRELGRAISLTEGDHQEITNMFNDTEFMHLFARALKLLDIDYIVLFKEGHPILEQINQMKQTNIQSDNVSFTPHFDTTKTLQ